MNEEPNIFINDSVMIGNSISSQKFKEVCSGRMSALKFKNSMHETNVTENVKKDDFNKSFMNKLKNIIKETKNKSNEFAYDDKG